VPSSTQSIASSVNAKSDGYRLNAGIRSPDPIPVPLMIDVLASLEAEMRRAVKGDPVTLTEWVTWTRKDKAHTNAIIRVLFLIAASTGLSADAVHELLRQFRDVSQSRRRAPRPIRETTPRKSPQLW